MTISLRSDYQTVYLGKDHEKIRGLVGDLGMVEARRFAKQFGLKQVFDVGAHGISRVVVAAMLIRKGYVESEPTDATSVEELLISTNEPRKGEIH